MQRSGRTQAGFTLIEVILAMALMVMVLTLLNSGTYIVFSDWNRNTDVLGESLDEALALLQIDRALHGAFPHSFNDEETLSRQIWFTGDEERLSWVSTVSPQRAPGLTAWELTMDDEGVFLSVVPAFADNPQQRFEEAEPRLLFPGYSIESRFLEQAADGALVWREEWQARERLQLPRAVYLHFEPEDPGKETWEVVARIRNHVHRTIQPNLVVTEEGP